MSVEDNRVKWKIAVRIDDTIPRVKFFFIFYIIWKSLSRTYAIIARYKIRRILIFELK